MLEIITKANELVKKHNMLSYGDTVVIGVSGGADSMLLLNYLINVQDEFNLKLIVANVEHGIRGEESVEDSKFVDEYCKEFGVRYEQLSIDAPSLSEQYHMSVEEISRQKRYEFFASFNPDKVATAHNLDDNIETVLFRLSRGTSIKGCAGIPPVRGNIIRPLLTCSSEEIRQACKASDIPYRVDSTNLMDEYSRNYIRHNIIPCFEKLNPSFSDAFIRFINTVNEDEACLETLANECLDKAVKADSLLINVLSRYDTSIVKRAIVKFFSLYGVELDELHLNKAYELTKKTGKYQIKNNIFAVSDKKRLRVASFENHIALENASIDEKIVSCDDFSSNIDLYKSSFLFFCDYDKIVGNIAIRPRDEGDKISPAGRNCTKSLKKLYNELSINVEDRDNIPVIYDNEGIIGIYGYCCDERVKLDDATESVLMLKINLED